MNYFTLDQTIFTKITASQSLIKSIKLKKNEHIKTKNILLVDDGRDSSKAVITQLLNLCNQDLHLEVFYLGSLIGNDELDINETLLTLSQDFKTLICVGFDQVSIQRVITENRTICTLSSHVNETATSNHIFLGYQRHIEGAVTNKIHPLSLGLGDLRSNPELVELAFRNQEFIDCNLNVLKRCELPQNMTTHINGIYSEDFCKALKICGSTSKAKILKLSGISNILDHLESELIADAIWYYLEGTNLNLNESPEDTDDMKEILLQSSDLDHEYIFVRSNRSNKLWFKYSVDNKINYIPCSESDYQKICQDEIPDRIINFI